MNCPRCNNTETVTRVERPGITMSGLPPVCKHCAEEDGHLEILANLSEFSDWMERSRDEKELLVTGKLQNDEQLKRAEEQAVTLAKAVIFRTEESAQLTRVWNQLISQIAEYKEEHEAT